MESAERFCIILVIEEIRTWELKHLKKKACVWGVGHKVVPPNLGHALICCTECFCIHILSVNILHQISVTAKEESPKITGKKKVMWHIYN